MVSFDLHADNRRTRANESQCNGDRSWRGMATRLGQLAMKNPWPAADDEEMAQRIELGVDQSALLVRELLLARGDGVIIPPRYLAWVNRPDGVLVTTDRSRFLVPPSEVEAFAPVLRAMVRPELFDLWGSDHGCDPGNC
jgi:hypothetical protein